MKTQNLLSFYLLFKMRKNNKMFKVSVESIVQHESSDMHGFGDLVVCSGSGIKSFACDSVCCRLDDVLLSII